MVYRDPEVVGSIPNSGLEVAFFIFPVESLPTLEFTTPYFYFHSLTTRVNAKYYLYIPYLLV